MRHASPDRQRAGRRSLHCMVCGRSLTMVCPHAIPAVKECAETAGTGCCELCRLREIARPVRTVHVPTRAANQLRREHGHGGWLHGFYSTRPGRLSKGLRQAKRPCLHGCLSTYSLHCSQINVDRDSGILPKAKRVITIPAAVAKRANGNASRSPVNPFAVRCTCTCCRITLITIPKHLPHRHVNAASHPLNCTAPQSEILPSYWAACQTHLTLRPARAQVRQAVSACHCQRN